jgi:uncharacterized protein YjiS (DUF1127 family)
MSALSAPSLTPNYARSSLPGRMWAMVKLYRRRRQHHRAARVLAALNDHLLKDMGISRSEIHGAVRGQLGQRRDVDEI